MYSQSQLIDLLIDLNTDSSSHSQGTLIDHLQNTYELLKQWNNPNYVCLAGLFHSIYGTQIYKKQTLGLQERNLIKEAIGIEAEYLVYLFCIMHRGYFYNHLHSNEVRSSQDGTHILISEKTKRNLCEILVANELEQQKRKMQKLELDNNLSKLSLKMTKISTIMSRVESFISADAKEYFKENFEKIYYNILSSGV
ncbi:MAG: hypothetical protein QNJ60_18460 [Xenococcaceae cyanobacterium MO_188.B19]|nr:hypothetical protein [Xenococcaceae cyanobacterium MO_188.B19]